ncbi:MBL fold metallo-hydrolase [Amycolatopsis acidicola]|uniref:MBL fold metallo-hydrolase n=1 Tax=Amycolatopsis acidicola TaxID=2596893 RepID=A0A5N0VML8_9PSEU|nr:MBL fold metallo-hydrolase [Amycolatopsis acidicola]KAA9166534.1 MBL fold metallo-hydrolase [Amycolatopsis acidicola]
MEGIFEPFDAGSVPFAPPFLTYTEGITLWVDDLRCEVRHVGSPAHTTNDSIVWVPERPVLFAGDLLFWGGTPFLLSGSIEGAARVPTDVIEPLGAKTIVPGHGPVCGPEAIAPTLRYLRFVQQVARDGVAAGLSPLDAAREANLGEFAAWSESERLAGNLHRAYAEVRGGAVDTAAAFRDMVTLNGGRPLHCRA